MDPKIRRARFYFVRNFFEMYARVPRKRVRRKYNPRANLTSLIRPKLLRARMFMLARGETSNTRHAKNRRAKASGLEVDE